MPTHNRSAWLPPLLSRLAEQTLPADRFEVVVVDDCSDDDTAAVLERLADEVPFRLVLGRTPVQSGPAVARNIGWKMASAPLLAFIDDDVTPSSGWLEAGLNSLLAQPNVGVIQGRTVIPPEDEALHARYGPPDWDHFHHIVAPTPFFQGCNIFFRRQTMEVTGGFDEQIGWWGEDTPAGWKALDAGWERGFASGALVTHPVDHRGWRWFVHNGALEYNLICLAAQFPGFRSSAFWRPWAYRKEDVAFKVAVLGGLLAMRFRPALVVAIPYLWWQRPSVRHRSFFRLCWQIPLVDAARSAGQIRGAIDSRILVL